MKKDPASSKYKVMSISMTILFDKCNWFQTHVSKLIFCKIESLWYRLIILFPELSGESGNQYFVSGTET